MLWRSSKKKAQKATAQTAQTAQRATQAQSTEAEPAEELRPLDGVDAILADLDGVVYKGEHAIAGAVESLNAAGVRVGYVTNNASRTAASVASHLSELGLSAAPDDVVTSSQAAVRLITSMIPAGSEILVVGGEGLTSEVDRAGFARVESASSSTAAVVQGFAPHVGWAQLAEAAFALQGEGAERPWVATNSDWTLPQSRGLAPGNGTLVSAVHTAVGRLPLVAGKPEVAIFEAAVERFDSRSPLFIGDRLDTDILGANRAGIRVAHVLTGVDGAKQLLAADPSMRPQLILARLDELFEPYPVTKHLGEGVVEVRGAAVRMTGNRVELLHAGDERWGHNVDLIRAATAAVWAAGLSIFAVDVSGPLLDALGIERPGA